MCTLLNKSLLPMRSTGAAIITVLLRLRKSPIALFFANRGPLIAVSLVVVCFIITRLPFFLHFRLADVAIDYWSYFDVVQQARHGQWPKLYLRTPGYPLFLAAVFSISRSAMAVVATQCVMTLVAALGTLACFVRVDRRLAYPAAFALVGFISSMHSVVFDTTLLAESLYSSLLMLSFGTLTFAILRGGAWACVSASFAMAGCIWMRPAGLYFLVIYGLVLGWLLLQRRPRRHVFAFLLPLPIIILATCTYNRLMIGEFVITPVGDHAIIGAVATYIEEDPTAPADINAAVREIRDSMTPADRAVAFTSRDPDEIYRVFTTYNEAAIYTHMGKVKREYLQLNRFQAQLAWLAIRRHPDLYLKFVAVNFYKFYQNSLLTPDLYNHLPVRYDTLYVRRDLASNIPESERRDLLMEYWDPVPQPHVRRVGLQTMVDTTWSRRMHERFNQVHDAIFSRTIWILGALLLFPVTIWKLLRSRARDAGAFLVFLHISALIGAGLVIALYGMGMTRYGAPTLFLCYLTPLYLCLLAWRKVGEETTTDLAEAKPGSP
jgi:hypothetical protein